MSKHRLALSAFGLALCATATPALAGDGTNLLGMISQDTQVIVVFDVADARDSALLQKGFQKLIAMQPDAQAKLTELGLDPMKDVDTLVFAGGGVADFDDMDGAKSMVVIVEGRLPKDKLSAMASATKSTYKGIEIWSKDDTDAAFIGDRMFFAKKGTMKGQIDLAQGKAKAKSIAGSKKAKALRAAIATTDTTADLWMTVLVPEKNKKEMVAQGIVANSISGALNFTADIAIGLRMESTNEDGAKKAVGMIQAAMGQATGMMGQIGLSKAAKSLTVAQDKASIKIGMTLTEAEINSLVAMAGMAGMGGGSTPPSPPPPAPAPKSKPMKTP